MVYLDTCIAVYAVEGQPPFQQRAQAHITSLQAAGERFAVSDLTKLDALHLAAAIEFACDSFLTNDTHLAGFVEMAVMVLP